MRALSLTLPFALLGLIACDKDDALIDDTQVEADADADSDTDSDSDSDADSESDADSDPAPTWSEVEPIFSASCGGYCHGTSGSGGLSITDRASLVGAASSVAGYSYVEPGSLEDSYLWHKLEGTQSTVGGSGEQMPKGSSLSAADKATLQDWILGGAQ